MLIYVYKYRQITIINNAYQQGKKHFGGGGRID